MSFIKTLSFTFTLLIFSSNIYASETSIFQILADAEAQLEQTKQNLLKTQSTTRAQQIVQFEKDYEYDFHIEGYPTNLPSIKWVKQTQPLI